MKRYCEKNFLSFLGEDKTRGQAKKYGKQEMEGIRKLKIKKNILHFSAEETSKTDNQQLLLNSSSFQVLRHDKSLQIQRQNRIKEKETNKNLIPPLNDLDSMLSPKFHNPITHKNFLHFIDLSSLLDQPTKENISNIKIMEPKIKGQKDYETPEANFEQRSDFGKRICDKFIKKDSRLQFNLNVHEMQKGDIKERKQYKKTVDSTIHRMGMEIEKNINSEIEGHRYFTPLTFQQILKNSLNNSLSLKQERRNEWKIKMRRQNENLRKYFSLNYTRYNLKEMKSLHGAILQYSKGDIALLKKGLVTVLNIGGILIQEDKLEQINILCSNNNYCLNKGRIKSRFQGVQNSKKSLLSSKSLKDLPGKLKKTLQSNMGQVVEQNITKISQFESFLHLFSLIEKFYFKQAIIDYLQILLSNHLMNLPTFKTKQTIQESCQIAKPKNVITSIQLYQAFRKRNGMKDAIKIINMVQAKLKEQYPEFLVPFYIHELQKLSRWAGQTQRKDAWRIDLQIVYKICYSDNQLCQSIYEFYMKEGSPENITSSNSIRNE